MIDSLAKKIAIRKLFSQGVASGGRGGPAVLAGPLIVVLVGLGAFGLGRLSVIEEYKGSLKIYAPPASSATGPSDTPRALAKPAPAPVLPALDSAGAHNYVASKNGSKYYPAGCSGASRIKAANQVWFETAAAAQAAGYTLAANCAQ